MVEERVEQQYDRRRIESFGRKITPLVREYLANNGPGVVMGVPTAGKLFAIELYRRLLAGGSADPYVDVSYLEIERERLRDDLEQNSGKIAGRHLIVVDDDIHTKKTYQDVQAVLESLKEQFEIPSISWAVEFDGPGIATWACNRINNGSKARV